MGAPTFPSQEEDALLPGPSHIRNTGSILPRIIRWKPHPYWLLPIVLIVSMGRGVTMSPRIQVYKAVACQALNETGELPGFSTDPISNLIDCTGPDVQARAARIQAAIDTLTNILSATSTGVWSRIGDTYGRKPVIAFFLLGAIIMDFVHVLVLNPHSILGRHPESFLLIGSAFEGVVGVPSYSGAINAYASDCAAYGSRSKVFSTMQGVAFVGIAAGPWISGLVLPQSTILNVGNAFYLSICLMCSILVYAVIFIPESHTSSSYQDNMPSQDRLSNKLPPTAFVRRQLSRFISAMLVPITIFKPRLIPGHSRRRNYNLTMIGLAYFIYIVWDTAVNVKYLYTQHAYHWTTAQLGYYISFLSVANAIILLVVLPYLISYLKPKPPPPGSALRAEDISREMVFDLRLSRYAFGLGCVADACIALLPTSSRAIFIGFSSLSSFASGGSSALNAVSVACLQAAGAGSESGALFGGLAVLSAGAHIIAPFLLALAYTWTVVFFPKAIFLIASGLLGIAVLLLVGINSRPEDMAVSERTSRFDDDNLLREGIDDD